MKTSGGKLWTTLGGAVGIVMVLLATSCGIVANDGPSRDSLQVVVLWTGYELKLFEQIVEGYEAYRSGDVKVDLVSPGDDLDSFIRARHQAGDPPDVALIPQPALIQTYAREGWLMPLDVLRDRYLPFWEDLGTVAVDTGGPGEGQTHFYGAWIKLTNKSLLWCVPDPDARIGESHDCDTFETRRRPRWNQLSDAVRALAGRSPSAPLALGAADGWPLTDWFENLLAAYDIAGAGDESFGRDCPVNGNDLPAPGKPRPGGELYQLLAGGEGLWDQRPVLQALCGLARVWSPEGAFPKPGVRRALLTQFDEAVIQVAGTRQASLVLGGDFASTIGQIRDADEVYGDAAGDDQAGTGSELPLIFFEFPSPTEMRPLILAGDAAVVFKDSEHGEDFVTWLSNEVDWTNPDPHYEPFRDALTSFGYILPLKGTYDQDICKWDDPPMCSLAEYTGRCTDQRLQASPCWGDKPDATRTVPRFDLSDQLPTACRDVLEDTLQDFLIDVGTGGDLWLAVDKASTTMQDTAEKGLCQQT